MYVWSQSRQAKCQLKSIIGLLCMMLLAAPVSYAQTGKLAGKILDDNGEAVIGATALVVGTTLGAAADINGDYIILQIPPGTYSVRFSSVGYQTKVVEGVLVTSNNTTTLDVTLSEEVIEGEEVVITAERPLVDVSLTSSMSTLSEADIAVLPVQALEDIVNLQAGVVDGHFRGGRVGEVQYQVDGVSVNNPYDNQSTLSLDRSVLQEVQVIQGTFDAEYGQAMSGVVNAVLRTGDEDRYEFSGEVFMGDFISPRNDSITVSLPFFNERDTVALFPYIDDIDPTTIQNYQFSLSGPVPVLPNTTFLFNGQRLVDLGHLMGLRAFRPTDKHDFEQQIFNPTGDSALIPMDFEKQWSWLAKVTNRSLPNIQIGYQVIANNIDRKSYNHGFRLNPDGTKTAHQFSIVHGLDLTHTLSNRMFYELSLRQNYFDYKDMKFEDLGTLPANDSTRIALPVDSPYYLPGQPRGDANFEEGAIIQGVDLGRFVQRTNSWVGKATFTNQATNVHLLKAGLEVQASDLEFGSPGQVTPTIVEGQQVLGILRDTLEAQVIKYRPVQAAAFIQDRIEWRDLRVRAGVRFEYFDANATVPRDLANPAGTITGAPELPSITVPTTVKLRVAPRIGLSFPILSQASMFFSYGIFYQMPGLGQLFRNADYTVLKDLQADVVSYGVMGNPDLKPEFTAQYEFGFKSEVAGFLGLDLSLFYKDIRDLLGVEFVQTYTSAEYARLTNVDFGGVRGFTLAFDQRGVGPLSTSLDYTLQTAVGNASDPRETANRAEAGEDPRPRQVPFAWDQRHTLNGTVIWYNPNSFSITGIVRFATGQPYTPSISTGFGADLEANSGRKPSYVTVDLRAEKFFNLGGLRWTAFARVFNLFDQHFTNGFVYADTGSPFYTLDPVQQRNPNPGRLNPPRRIEIGISLRGMIQR